VQPGFRRLAMPRIPAALLTVPSLWLASAGHSVWGAPEAAIWTGRRRDATVYSSPAARLASELCWP